MCQQRKYDYCFSPSILKSFTDYLNCEEIWETYHQSRCTLEEYEQEAFLDLINTINKVEKEASEAALRGTAFNEIVDCLIHDRKPKDGVTLGRIVQEGIVVGVRAELEGYSFEFPISLCYEFKKMYDDTSLSQYHTKAPLKTQKGTVLLHGFLDETTPFKIHDIKTTTSYEPFKYSHGWQHKVYLYCMRAEGAAVDTFQYDICYWGSKKDYKPDLSKYEILHETYVWHEEDENDIRLICEDFIDFLNRHKSLITNEKIFGNVDY